MIERRITAALRVETADVRLPHDLKDRIWHEAAKPPHRSGWTARMNWKVAAATLAAALLLVPATMLAMGEPILGIRVIISDMSAAEWVRKGFSGWLASPGAPEFLSPEETVKVAPFPIRIPAWIPDGYEPVDEPRGAYSNLHAGGRWQVSEDVRHFFVTQSFRTGEAESDNPDLSILHTVRPLVEKLTVAPGTEVLEVAGHPAFLQMGVPLAKADKISEDRSRRGELPEIVGSLNRLDVWVNEQDGQISEISVLGDLPKEILLRVAESLFTR